MANLIPVRANLIFIIVAGALFCSVSSHGQAFNGQSREAVSNMPDDENKPATTDTAAAVKERKTCFLVSGDFAGCAIKSAAGGTSQTANGLTWAVSAQVALRLNKHSDDHSAYISAGLEARNFNGYYSSDDDAGITAYDNLHYYYVGIPIIFQYVKHPKGKTKGISYYLQAGVHVGFKVSMKDYYSDDGTNTNTDVSKYYNSLIVQPTASIGISYTTKSKTYLLGPYFGYTVNNLNNQDGVTENIMSYGLRLTAMFGK